MQESMDGVRQRSHQHGDDEVYWPENVAVADWVGFRGPEVNNEIRSWKEIPYPEQLGLAREILLQEHLEPDLAMSGALGIGRLRAKMRQELNDALASARETLNRDEEHHSADPKVTSIRSRRG